MTRLLMAFMHAAEPFGGWSLRQVQVNGQPGAKGSADGHISAVRSIVNPYKLRQLDQATS